MKQRTIDHRAAEITAMNENFNRFSSLSNQRVFLFLNKDNNFNSSSSSRNNNANTNAHGEEENAACVSRVTDVDFEDDFAAAAVNDEKDNGEAANENKQLILADGSI